MRNRVSACLWVLLLTMAVPALAQQSKGATIAVAANGNSVVATVGNQPGRSPYFLLFDAKGAFVGAANNPYKDAENAGIPALDFLAGKGIKIVVAESFGPKIVQVMKDKGMRSLEFKGVSKNAVKKALELK